MGLGQNFPAQGRFGLGQAQTHPYSKLYENESLLILNEELLDKQNSWMQGSKIKAQVSR